MRTLKYIQNKAKKMGHCLCDLKKTCLCQEFIDTGKCPCFENVKKMDPMKFSFVGNGFIFPRHLDAVKAAGGEIVGRNNGEDCTVILTPNDLHFYQIKNELAKGKIVLCEKPLVINMDDMNELLRYKNVYTVLQLRYHPLVKQLQQEIANNKISFPKMIYEIEMDIAVHRDPDFFTSWKGQTERCGGVIYELGIHYIDLLLYLFGPVTSSTLEYENQKEAKGTISGKNYKCNFRICLDTKKKDQHRTFKVNRKDYNFSSKDNLSYENLHQHVYEDLMKGIGITPKDILPVHLLIETLHKKS